MQKRSLNDASVSWPTFEPTDEAGTCIAIAGFIRHIAIIQPRYYERELG
jgi:hypothetical protein